MPASASPGGGGQAAEGARVGLVVILGMLHIVSKDVVCGTELQARL